MTTAILIEYAEYMNSKGNDILIVSVEENEKYLQLTKKHCENIYPNGVDLINFVKCDRVQNFDGCYYSKEYNEILCDYRIDLLYVDGPSAPNRIPCIDAIFLKDRVKDVLFDHRTPSVLKCLPHYIADHAFLPYRSVDNSIWKGDSFRHHSIFKECSRFK